MSNSKKHLVVHHNMFGPSCEVAGINNPCDFEIYCYREHKICVPTCENCKYFAGSEMGKGIACEWQETYEAVSGDEHFVQHDEAYFEFQRVENPELYKEMMRINEDNDFDLCEAWLGLD